MFIVCREFNSVAMQESMYHQSSGWFKIKILMSLMTKIIALGSAREGWGH